MKIRELAKSAVKALLPFQPALRRLKRRWTPYSDNPDNSAFCISQGLAQIAALRAASVDVSGDVLEFGTGWLPLIPLLFHLAGARSLVLTDVERLMDEATIELARTLIAARLDEIAGVLGVTENMLRDRLKAPFNYTYFVPWDAGRHPPASVDIVISRAAFEHVPVVALRGFLGAFARILRPGGAMCHIVDNSDHWEHRDKSLSRVNFLRYDQDLRWKVANFNLQDYQNRLRHSDYLALFEQAGFEVVRQEGEPDPRTLDELETLPLAPAFRGREARDLAILTSLFVARPKAKASTSF